MTERYVHLQPEHLEGVVGAIDNALAGMDTQMDTQPNAEEGSQNPPSAKSLKTG
jgi:hypothetical protein